jgi:hypothetical protein
MVVQGEFLHVTDTNGVDMAILTSDIQGIWGGEGKHKGSTLIRLPSHCRYASEPVGEIIAALMRKADSAPSVEQVPQ